MQSAGGGRGDGCRELMVRFDGWLVEGETELGREIRRVLRSVVCRATTSRGSILGIRKVSPSSFVLASSFERPTRFH